MESSCADAECGSWSAGAERTRARQDTSERKKSKIVRHFSVRRGSHRRSRVNMSEEKKEAARVKNRLAKRRARMKKRQSSQKKEKEVKEVGKEACQNEEEEV